MSHHVPGPQDYDVVMTEQVPGLNGPKMLGRHKPTAPCFIFINSKEFECVEIIGVFRLLF